MILLAFMGLSLFVCFIWSFVLLKRILYMNSDEVISMVSLEHTKPVSNAKGFDDNS